MISWLTGVLLEKQAPSLVLNVNGVGYQLEAPMTTFYDLPEQGATATLFVHMVVREDAQLLFGFSSKQQRDLFRSLIKVNGVGPKVALAVLSTLSPLELLQCMANEDVVQLCKVPGIGKKTAQLLVLAMKDRLEKEFGDVTLDDNVNKGVIPSDRQDAIAALVSLGYKQGDASRVVKALPAELSSEDMIRQSLRTLSGKVL